MWFLKSLEDAKLYYLRPDILKHVVSRSTGNLIITGDPSISRNHAFLFPESADTLKLVDAGSRYGTFLNYAIESDREEIPRDVPVRLSKGDRIRFGKCKSLWVVDQVEFRCITSTISSTDELGKVLGKLGGSLEESFQEGKTKFLVMKTITTTPKLLMSLIGQVPVVKPEYFEQCVRSVEKGLALPDEEDYIPEFTETYVRREGISFKKLPERQKLFEGLTFVFIKTKHMTQYEGIVKFAGGKCICAQSRKIAKSFFTQDKVVVIQVMTDTMSQVTSQAVDGLTQILSNADRRLIPEAEIGLAILNCSLERYCNPRYKFTNVLDLDTVPFEPHADTLAKNSEDLPGRSKKTSSAPESISIPETEPHDSLPQSTNFSELKISEIESEFAKSNENDTTTRPKRKRSEPVEAPKEVKKLRSKPVEEQPQQIEIPETPSEPSPPPPSQAPSQSASFSGFLSVNHEEALQESTTAAQKPKRPLQLMLDDGEDDLFNFGEAVPKRAKRQQTLAESFTSQRSQTQPPAQPTGDDLFAFGGRDTSRRSKRTVESTPSTASQPEPNNNTNSSTSAYKQFIKPIQIPADGWLSSTFCELKIKTQDGDGDGDGVEVKVKRIKEEPDDEDHKTRVWIDGMQSMFQVRVKCMNLTSHRSGRDESSDRSFFSTGCGPSAAGGGKNFKAFVKKHNYKPQQTIVKTMPVCVLDSTQDDHF